MGYRLEGVTIFTSLCPPVDVSPNSDFILLEAASEHIVQGSASHLSLLIISPSFLSFSLHVILAPQGRLEK